MENKLKKKKKKQRKKEVIEFVEERVSKVVEERMQQTRDMF